MLKKWIALLVTMMLLVAGCNSPVYNQTENNVADVKLKAKAARAQSDDNAKVKPSLVMNKGSYIDRTPISLMKNPSWLKSHIVIKGDQLPFSYFSRTIGSGAGYGILTKYQNGLDPNLKISMNYSGTIRGALDLLASKSGYVYNVQGSSIYWQAFITKTYDIAFMPGGTDYLMGKKGGGGSSSGGTSGATDFTTADSSSDQYSNLTGKLSVWTDLKATLDQLISPDGKVTVSQATTTITVRDRPTNQALIGQFISNLNSKLSKQVLVKIQILQVNLENDYNLGINWQIIANAFNKSPFVLNANYGTPISITSFTPQSTLPATVSTATTAAAVPQMGTIADPNGQFPSYTILFNALTQQGKTSVVTEPRVVCLNNQVSVIKITQQRGYVASVQNTTLSGTSGTAPTSTVTSQITPGNIITGVTLYILPKILDSKIYLQVNADISLVTALDTFGSGNTQIQLPTVDSKSFNQRGVIRSGETLILAGFRQLGNQARAQQFLKSQALGGKAATQNSQETVILITPIVLDNFGIG